MDKGNTGQLWGFYFVPNAFGCIMARDQEFFLVSYCDQKKLLPFADTVCRCRLVSVSYTLAWRCKLFLAESKLTPVFILPPAYRIPQVAKHSEYLQSFEFTLQGHWQWKRALVISQPVITLLVVSFSCQAEQPIKDIHLNSVSLSLFIWCI